MALHGPVEISELSRKLSLDLDQTVEIVPLDDAGLCSKIHDSTSKFLVHTKTGGRFFLIVSGEGNKQLMSRSAKNIQTVCNVVRPEIAKHLLRPIATGDVQEFSYTAWLEKRRFPRAGRLQRYLTRNR
jgi:hypothetical protein